MPTWIDFKVNILFLIYIVKIVIGDQQPACKMSKNNSTITWAVIGAGDVCEIKSVPAMYKLENSMVKSVMRRNITKAKDFARRHTIQNAYDDADKIFNDPDIDIVYISTPPSSHAELAIRAAKAGKAAYVEKPMARTHKECLAMIGAFEKANRPLFVAYYRRALPNFLKVKEIIDSGLIGDVRMVIIEMNKSLKPADINREKENWRVDPKMAGGGYFYDLASHQLDFLDYALGPIAKVRGVSANQSGLYKAEDIVSLSFQFESGVLGSGTWSFNTGKSSEKDMTSIIGSKGQINYISFGDGRVFLKTDAKGEEVFHQVLPEHIESNLIQIINNELRGIGKCPSTGISGARTNWVLEEGLL